MPSESSSSDQVALPDLSWRDVQRCSCSHRRVDHARPRTEHGQACVWLACKCQGFELPVTVDEYGHRSDCEGCAGPNCGPPAPERTECGYSEHGFKPFQGPKDEPGKPHCLTCGHAWGECSGHWAEDDPPLTPEEEEELALKEQEMEAMASAIYPEGPPCSEVDGCDGQCCARAAPKPPQPEHRPPYAVAYSVNGHLYEVALIIQHSLGPVAGIVQVLPVKSKEAS